MSSRALIAPIINLQPNPLPYGELRVRKGAWDQLQASKAYQESVQGGNVAAIRKAALDLEI